MAEKGRGKGWTGKRGRGGVGKERGRKKLIERTENQGGEYVFE